MVKTYTIEFTLDTDPKKIIEAVEDPKILTSFWRFVDNIDLESEPPKVTLRFKKFGFTGKFDYVIKIEKKENEIKYRGEAEDRYFEIVINVDKSGNGSNVKLTVSYSGPYEAFSSSFLKDFAEGIEKGLKALARIGMRKEMIGRGKLKDASYIVKLMATGRLLVKKTLVIKDEFDLQALFALLYQLSKERLIFARAQAGEIAIRLLVMDGNVVDVVMSSPRGTLEGAEVIDKLFEVLKGKEVELMVLEAPQE